MKLAGCKSVLKSPVVYSTDRSEAVVPLLVLLFVALWLILRGDLFYKKKGKRKVQRVPQSQSAALPRPQEEEETDKSKQAQTEQTYEKHQDQPLTLCLTLCHFVFFSPFSIAITSLGEERANLSAFRTFVRFVLVWICRFPLPLSVWEGLRFVIVALPGLFF